MERGLLSKLQAEVLKPEVIKYTLERFGQELARVFECRRSDLEALTIRKAKIEGELKNLTAAIAGGTYSVSILEAIKVRENELQSITNHLLESRSEPAKASLTGVREFVLSRLGNLVGLLNRDAITARTELAKHVRVINLYPDGATYKARGDWDYLGDARMVQLRPAAPLFSLTYQIRAFQPWEQKGTLSEAGQLTATESARLNSDGFPGSPNLAGLTG